MTVLFDQRGAQGVRTTLFRDPDWRCPIIRSQQDVSAILAANREDAKAWRPEMQRNPLGLRLVARIPHVVMAQLEARGIVTRPNRHGRRRLVDHQALMRFLNDPDHRWLRTDNGKRL